MSALKFLQADLESLARKFPQYAKELKAVGEALKYSDPMSHSSLVVYEEQIQRGVSSSIRKQPEISFCDFSVADGGHILPYGKDLCTFYGRILEREGNCKSLYSYANNCAESIGDREYAYDELMRLLEQYRKKRYSLGDLLALPPNEFYWLVYMLGFAEKLNNQY